MREQNSRQRAMPLSSEEDKFLEVASDALPRIIEIIATFPVGHRAGAFEVAERRYMQARRILAAPKKLPDAGSLQLCESCVHQWNRRRWSEELNSTTQTKPTRSEMHRLSRFYGVRNHVYSVRNYATVRLVLGVF